LRPHHHRPHKPHHCEDDGGGVDDDDVDVDADVDDDSRADSVRHRALPRRIGIAWTVPMQRTAGAADLGAVKPPATHCNKKWNKERKAMG